MIKEMINKITNQVENLGEEIERIELDNNGAYIYIKIKESNRIHDDFYLVGEKETIIESLIEIKNNSITDLKSEIEETKNDWNDIVQERVEQKQWYESQI